MMNNEETFRQLIQGHIDDTLTEAQEEQLFAWVKDPAYQNLLERFIDESILLPQPVRSGITDEQLQGISRFILSTRKPAQIRRFPGWTRVAVAASIMLLLSMGAWLFYNNQTSTTDKIVVIQSSDVQAPATNRATITLSDGSTIYLDSAGNGTLTTVNGVQVVKNKEGEIVYQSTNQVLSDSRRINLSTQYHTLTNPRGSKVIDMTLSDGSRVWLNAGSSVTYPVAFISNERSVSITGEAYFEVTSDKTKPFKVIKGDMQVEVLGTHFNVNAYDDEKDIKVTLLEGAVRLKMNEESQVLKPGEQALVSNTVSIKKDADLEAVMAWKDGRFKFSSVDIETIMRQAARWYDVDVEFRGKVDGTLSGGVARNANASQLFHVLELTEKVRFEIAGRKVFVIPK